MMLRQRARERSIAPDLYTFQKSVLHVVSAHGNTNSAAIFLAAGAECNSRDRFGQTPLIYAITGKKYDMMDLLIVSGADVNLPDNDGKLPLTFSIINNDLKAAKVLVDHGAAIDLIDNKGSSPLHVAASCSHDALKLLLEEFKKTDKNENVAEVRDAKGRTMLMVRQFLS